MSFYAYSKAGEARYQERFGLDFEEFAVGQRFKHRPGVTLSQQDNLDEALEHIRKHAIEEFKLMGKPPRPSRLLREDAYPVMME